MNKTQVFLSSTCYDLSALRESIRELLLRLGHEPILSEFASFPVSPDQSAIENCKQNVRMHADILILVIGGKRGFLDDGTGKSITNLEYDEARRAGIPCFVFVQRKIIDYLHVWKRNPTADFNPDIDSPEVFQFVERIRGENHWTFSFDRMAEIEEVLTNQFSGMLRELLGRKRQGTLDPIADFRGDSDEAQRIARDKPKGWELMLSTELLRTRLKVIRRNYDKVLSGHYYVPACNMDGPAFFGWIRECMHNAGRVVSAMKLQVDGYAECWGPAGTPGDLLEIKEATDDLTHLAAQCVEWAKAVQAVNLHPIFEPCRNLMCRVIETVLDGMDEVTETFAGFLNEDHPIGSTVQKTIALKGGNFDPVTAEIERLQALLMQSPELRSETGFE